MPRFSASWRLRHLLAVVATFSISFVIGSFAQGNSPDETLPQPLFAAIAAGDLEAQVVPRDSKRLTIQFKNKTDRPLTIQMPAAMAAAPILAQQQPFNFFPGQPNNQQPNNRQQSPQQLGMPGMNNNNGGNNNLFGNGIFNIPAGRAIKIKADCVCLEYGKPEPDARMKYELKPLAEVCDKPELATMLRSLGDEQIDQRVAQAAAWHLTNELGWDELAGLVSRRVGSYTEHQFTSAQIAVAKRTLGQIASNKQSPKVGTVASKSATTR
ncbi:hypothetical protein ETAA8_56540 [Anatilimnocola aggregata]|uniref:Uncharacterized protein n=1 Tax=Anatilimnocola aggregata TaxID=2528021 RepID=A0A517YJV8_9BACT|nr:hypothetical protein [Anatilimnocola aggregata]QDU30509.1 hypothetical protein ETAA8_56540 [Anatilimnocola aggregata]